MADPADVQRQLEQSVNKGTEALKRQEEAVKSLESRFAELGNIAGSAFGLMSSRLEALTSVANPALFAQFTWEVRNLSAAFGNLFLPILERATQVLHGINEAISSMTPGARQMAVALTAGAGVAGAFAVALNAVGGGLLGMVGKSAAALASLFGLTAGEGAATAGAAALDVATGGILPVLGAVATLAVGAGTAFAFLGGSADKAGGWLSGLKDALGGVWQAVEGLAEALRPALQSLGAAFGDWVGVAGGALKLLVEDMTPAVTYLARVFSGLVKVIGLPFEMGVRAAKVFGDTLAPLVSGLETLWRSVTYAVNSVADAFEGLLDAGVSIFGQLLSALKPFVSGIMDGLVKALAVALEGLTRLVVTVGVLSERMKQGRLFAGDLFGEIDKKLAELKKGQGGGPAGYTVAPGSARIQGLEQASRRLQEASIGAQLAKAFADQGEKKEDPKQPEKDTASNTAKILEWLQNNAKGVAGAARGAIGVTSAGIIPPWAAGKVAGWFGG